VSIINKIFTFFTSDKVGADQFGNRYYVSRFKKDYLGNKARYIMYKGIADPSKVPPMWHAWLHYLSDNLPKETRIYSWQKNHIPNLTGTKLAYIPAKSGVRYSVSADYTPWFPWRTK
jgi:NADH:ubiquinone oxidoreductase subunit